eukprot:3001471-Prymnesium_polylepis.1
MKHRMRGAASAPSPGAGRSARSKWARQPESRTEAAILGGGTFGRRVASLGGERHAAQRQLPADRLLLLPRRGSRGRGRRG